MLVYIPLPITAVRLLADTCRDRPVTLIDGEIIPGRISPWHFFASTLHRGDDKEIFIVRLFRSKEEWNVQFENMAKGYSFSRVCAAPSWSELCRTLRLLIDDAKYGFTLPF